MDWIELKKKIYYWDGSWRDIYVFNTTREDWQMWADYVSKTYKATFEIFDTTVRAGNVDLSKVFNYWDGAIEEGSSVTIFMAELEIDARFVEEHQIENFIGPDKINCIEDHNKVISYMKEVSKLLNKKVQLTPENEPEIVLISVDKDDVFFQMQ
jgi:hypothetical protein